MFREGTRFPSAVRQLHRAVRSASLALVIGVLSVIVGGCATARPTAQTSRAEGWPAFVEPDQLRGQVYRVGRSDLERTMGERGSTRRFARVGWRMPAQHHFNCHTQGLAVSGDRVVTSCADRRGREGWLQIYEAKDLSRFADARDEGARRVRLHGEQWPHPAVGQALLGQGELAGRSVLPIVHEGFGEGGSDGPVGGALIELRDERGGLLCSIDHPYEGGLAAVALTVHRDRLWVFAVAHSELFVYGLDRLPTDGGDCRARLRHAGPASDRLRGGRWRRYAALATFSTEDGELFLMGSAHHRLDTYGISGLDSPDFELDRVAQMRWKPRGIGNRGVFYEGMTIEQLDASTMRIWAAPHDYWRGVCRPLRVGARCTKAVYVVEQRLAPGAQAPERNRTTARDSRAAR